MIYVDERIMHVECALLLIAKPASVSDTVKQTLVGETMLVGLIYRCCGLKTGRSFQVVTRQGLKAKRIEHAVRRLHDG